MKDIKCPSCGKTFNIDPTSFEEILLQIKDEEFNKQIEERLQLAEEDKMKRIEIVKQDLKIQVPEDALGVQRWECEVTSNDNVASMIKELNLKLPEGADVDFRAGGYVQLEIPPYDMSWSSIDVQDEYREDWDKFNFWDLKSKVDETTIRAYSMANYPEEKGILKFNIRVSPPPPRMDHLPPGAMTSYVANLKPGDKITVFGPYGDFFVKDTPAEKSYGDAKCRKKLFSQRVNCIRNTSNT